MHSFTFLRHGESIGNTTGIIQGQFDSPLSEKGHQQVKALINYWLRMNITFDMIFTSPLSRALETARYISDRLNIPLKIDELWKERTFGLLEGNSLEAIRQSEPEINFYHPFLPPAINAESTLDLFTRASAAVQKLVQQPEASYLIVSHGALLNMVMYVVMGISPVSHQVSPRFLFENTGYAEFFYTSENTQWKMKKFNSTEHLLSIEVQNNQKE